MTHLCDETLLDHMIALSKDYILYSGLGTFCQTFYKTKTIKLTSTIHHYINTSYTG